MRAVRPDIALSGDFIVGFPGETEAEFAETLRLIDAVGYAAGLQFQVLARAPAPPPRRWTARSRPKSWTSGSSGSRRRSTRSQLAFNRASLGRRCAVLVERRGKLPGQWLGKTPWLQSAHFEAEAAIGDLVEVELAQAGAELAARPAGRASTGLIHTRDDPPL